MVAHVSSLTVKTERLTATAAIVMMDIMEQHHVRLVQETARHAMQAELALLVRKVMQEQTAQIVQAVILLMAMNVLYFLVKTELLMAMFAIAMMDIMEQHRVRLVLETVQRAIQMVLAHHV